MIIKGAKIFNRDAPPRIATGLPRLSRGRTRARLRTRGEIPRSGEHRRVERVC